MANSDFSGTPGLALTGYDENWLSCVVAGHDGADDLNLDGTGKLGTVAGKSSDAVRTDGDQTSKSRILIAAGSFYDPVYYVAKVACRRTTTALGYDAEPSSSTNLPTNIDRVIVRRNGVTMQTLTITSINSATTALDVQVSVVNTVDVQVIINGQIVTSTGSGANDNSGAAVLTGGHPGLSIVSVLGALFGTSVMSLAGSGSFATASWLSSVGLLWSTGVEPAGNEATLYPLQGSNRAWYVDANAGVNGTGTSASPFKSLTALNAYGSLSGYAAGDHIYMTGDFTQTKHVVGSNEMGLNWQSTTPLGTRANPTVIRSWPGRSRAKVDGEYNTGANPICMCSMPAGAATTKGIVFINIEATRCNPAGLRLYQGGDGSTGLVRIISCWLHHNYVPSTGPNSAYGGAIMQVREAGCDIKIYNNLAHDNRSPDGVNLVQSDNSGCFDIHTGPDSGSSTIEAYNNDIFNEYRGFGNKWSGKAEFTGHHNRFRDVTMAHFVRMTQLYEVHHELCINADFFIFCNNQNRTTQANQLRTIRWYNNTLVNIADAEFRYWKDGDSAPYADITRGYNNIFSNASKTSVSLKFGSFSDDGFAVAGMDYFDNCVYTNNSSTFALENSANFTRAAFDSQQGTSNVYANPLFTNAGAGDYTLQAGSPALSINGQRAGAF